MADITENKAVNNSNIIEHEIYDEMKNSYIDFKVEHHAHGAVLEFNQFVRLHLVEAIDVRHAVTHLQHLANLLKLNLVAHVLELHLQDA